MGDPDGHAFVAEVKRLGETLARTIHNLSLGEVGENGIVGSGYLATGAGMTAARQPGSGNKTEEKRRRFEREMLKAAERLNQLYDDMDRYRAAMDENRKNIGIWDRIIARLENDEELARDPDGSFKDEELERLIRKREERTGERVDRGDDLLILEVAREERERELENLQFNKDQFEKAEREAEEIAVKLDAGDPRDFTRAMRRATTAGLNVAVTDLTGQEERADIRRARGRTEAEIAHLEEADQTGQLMQGFDFNEISFDVETTSAIERPTSLAKTLDDPEQSPVTPLCAAFNSLAAVETEETPATDHAPNPIKFGPGADT